MAEPAAGEGPSYIALLRWFWTFVGLDDVPIGGSALNDGRHYLRAVAILAPQVTQLIAGYGLACDSADDAAGNFALLAEVLPPSGLHVRDGLVADLEARRFHAVHEFLRLLHHRSITSNALGAPAAADASPDDELLDGCFARAVLWMLQLLARWPRPPPDAGGGGLHADLKDLHGRLVNRRISAAFAEEPSLSARLCSGEVYALACALVFNVPLAELQRPSALETQTRVLEFLAQQGYHVLDADGDAAQAAQQLATGSGTGSDERWVHMSVLWRMMEAHTHSILDLTAVWTHAAALLAVPNPDELGDDGFSEAGEALQSWMEAVCTKFDRALATVQQRHGKTPSEIQRAMPAVTDLVGGFCDGVCVPGLWSFYLPKQVPTMRFQFFRKSRASLGLF